MRAVRDKKKGLGNYNVALDEDALDHLAWVSNGDLRTALNALELAVLTTDPDADGKIRITRKIATEVTQRLPKGALCRWTRACITIY